MKDYHSETANIADIEELREICRPVIEYLHQQCCPHDRVIVDWNSAELVEGAVGIGYEVPD